MQSARKNMTAKKTPKLKNVSLDSLDFKIMNLLQKNAKISNTKIAKEIGLTPPSTLERVKKLEDSGIIEGYYTRFNKDRIKYAITTFVGVSLSCHNKEHFEQFNQMLKDLPQVVECYHTTGKYDFLLKVIAKDISGLHDFLMNQLNFSSLIGHVETFLILKEDHYGIDMTSLYTNLTDK
jgi:DNA-binding Lrp family transcriptional regulator